MKRKRKLRIQSPAQAKVEVPRRPRLTKTNRIIRTDKSREIQFLTLCNRIRIDDFKNERSDQQKEERSAKRLNKIYWGEEV